MAGHYREAAQRPQSVLVATTISSGCQERYFESGLGLEYGVGHHTFDSYSHSISKEDEQNLVEIVTRRSGSDPSFFGEYIQRADTLGRRLIGSARSSSVLAEQSGNNRDLLAGFLGVTEAMREMVPFVVATPIVLNVLASGLGTRVAEEARAGNPGLTVSDVLPELLHSWTEPDEVGDMRNGYRIALEVLRNAETSELFQTTAPAIALRRVEGEFPELHQMIRNHVDEYGWLRAQGYRFAPLSPETLVYRIQLALIRWPREVIQVPTQPQRSPTAEEMLGFPPSDALAGQISAIQTMLARRDFRVDIHLQAESIARPFFAKVAEALGCTTDQVLFSSVEEIVAGLADETALPMGAIDCRAGTGFTVEREHGAVVVHCDDTDSADGGGSASGTGVLTGMTACRGTAVGRVKIVLDQSELLRLEVGDVLVTAASTIDPTDVEGSTVFPTRSGGPFAQALERAAAVVVDEGGLLSHAAIVCRERGLTCVLGTETATTDLVDGQVVEVDALKPVGSVIPLGPG